MFFNAFLLSLFLAAAVAAPTPNIPCTGVNSSGINPAPSPNVILLNNPSTVNPTPSPSIILLNSPPSDVNPTPSPSIILLNDPSAVQPTSSSPYDNYAASPQALASPSIINLNAPASGDPLSVIHLNRRQFQSTSSSSTFSFGGIVPTSTPPASPLTPTTFSSSSFNLGGIVSSSSPNPAFTPAPSNGPSEFTTTGANGLATVLLLSTVTLTVTNAACSTPLAFTPQPALAASSPFFIPAASSSSPININAQTPSATSASSFTIIDLNVPSSSTPTPAAGFSFTSTPASSVTPAPSPANLAPPANCDLSCQLTATL